MKVYEKLFSLFVAQDNCKVSMGEWYWKHNENIESIVEQYLPSGSGFDNGCRMEIEKCSRGLRKGEPEQLVFKTHYHAMDDNGFYDGWEEYYISITPSFMGFNLDVRGSNRNGLREYVGDIFFECLDMEYIEQNV